MSLNILQRSIIICQIPLVIPNPYVVLQEDIVILVHSHLGKQLTTSYLIRKPDWVVYLDSISGTLYCFTEQVTWLEPCCSSFPVL